MENKKLGGLGMYAGLLPQAPKNQKAELCLSILLGHRCQKRQDR